MAKPIVLVKMCYTSFENDLLTSADIKIFGCTYLYPMLLLIGLAIGVFI